MTEASHVLTEERSKCASRVDEAISSLDVEAVSAALQDARSAGVEVGVINRALSALAQLDRTDDGDEVSVLRVRSYQCPTCASLFQSEEEVRQHWLSAHGPNASASSVVEEQVKAESEPAPQPGPRARCPTCGDIYPSVADVEKHWFEAHAPKTQKAPASPEPAQSAVPNSSPVVEQVVAVDEAGERLVFRESDPEGGSRTVVRNPDGTRKVFNETTVMSLASAHDSDIEQLIKGLTDVQLRGLVHESTERVVDASQGYHKKKAELHQMGSRLNLVYFGLPADADEKAVDNAYRKCARSMHPDKNGGTEAAKEKFQSMKARYEALKTHFARERGQQPAEQVQESSPEQTPSEEKPGSERDGDQDKENDKTPNVSDSAPTPGVDDSGETKRREAYEEDETPSSEDAANALACDYANRKSLEEMAWKMVRQMKNIKQNLDILNEEYARYEAALKGKH